MHQKNPNPALPVTMKIPCFSYFQRQKRQQASQLDYDGLPKSGTESDSGTLVCKPGVDNKSGASTPDARASRADAFVGEVLQIHETLVPLESLAPGKIVNECLSRLVAMSCEVMPSGTVDMILENDCLRSILPSLRLICASAECELEAHWAAKVSQPSPAITTGRRGGIPLPPLEKELENEEEIFAKLSEFPYWQNYTDLTRLELCAMCAVDPRPPRRIAFIGSGPLPLTSLALLRALRRRDVPPTTRFEFNVYGDGAEEGWSDDNDVTVLNVDRSESAIAASRELSRRLGRYGRGMEFCCADAGSWEVDLVRFDVVYLAALVGFSTEEKSVTLERLASRMRPGSLIVARSCHGLKSCLYPEFDMQTESLLKVLDIGTIVHPYNEVVNSVIVARVK